MFMPNFIELSAASYGVDKFLVMLKTILLSLLHGVSKCKKI